MADQSKIEWTDAPWNPVTGCSVVSPGCTNCYAMKLAGGRLRGHPSREGLTVASRAGPVWNGKVRLNTEWLDQPLRWTKPRRIFVCAHGDLFHESVPDAWIDRVFAVMALSPRHTFQVLTKRAARMRSYMAKAGPVAWSAAIPSPSNLVMSKHEFDCRLLGVAPQLYHQEPIQLPLPNVWLGVSAEDQPRADERVPELLATPAAVRFVSYEPALGPIDFGELDINGDGTMDALKRRTWGEEIAEGWRGTSDTWEEDFLDWYSLGQMPAPETAMHSTLDWVICGGESGVGPRPMHPAWARKVRDDCAAAGVPFFFKQWGAWAPIETWRPGRVLQRAILQDGRDVPDDVAPQEVGGQRFAFEGKEAAGRLLDGVTHDAMPGARP